ncbi:MAG: MBL fold metallo-hydrolase [Patescibacteria group bacterium]|nr:MBL fold metallo-hydrolase [Patescibacteria group bacterium]
MKLSIEKIVVGLLATNCYLVMAENKDLAIIDPGDDPDKIIEHIEKLGQVNPRYILLTHAHYDHVAAVYRVHERYPKTEILLSKKDGDFSKVTKEKDAMFDIIFPGIEYDYKDVAEGQKILLGDSYFQVIETPGHTKGSVCYLIDKYLFSGDTLFYKSHGITDLPGGNNGKMRVSLKKLSDLTDDIVVYPGHLIKTTIGDEKKSGILPKE